MTTPQTQEQALIAAQMVDVLRAIVAAEWTTVTLQTMTMQHRRRLESARCLIREWDAAQSRTSKVST